MKPYKHFTLYRAKLSTTIFVRREKISRNCEVIREKPINNKP